MPTYVDVEECNTPQPSHMRNRKREKWLVPGSQQEKFKTSPASPVGQAQRLGGLLCDTGKSSGIMGGPGVIREQEYIQ